MDVIEFVKLLKEKIRTVSVILICGILIGILGYFVLPPIFECRTTFMVLESKMIRRTLEGIKLDINTYLDFVNNETIFRSVYDREKIGERFELDFDEFKRSFEITSVEDTAIINLMVSFEDADTCRRIADEIGRMALELNRRVIDQELKASHRFSEEEIVRAADKVEQSRMELDRFLDEHPINRMSMKLDNLRNLLSLERTGAFNVYPPLEGLGAPQLQNPQFNYSGFSYTENDYPSLAQAESELLELEARLTVATSDNQKLQLKKKLDETTAIIDRKKLRIQNLENRLSKLGNAYYPLKNKYLNLVSELYASRKGYEELYRQALETKLEVAGKTKEMTIIDPAVLPDKPIFPKLVFTLLGGLFLGVLTSFCMLIIIGFNRRLTDA